MVNFTTITANPMPKTTFGLYLPVKMQLRTLVLVLHVGQNLL